MSEQVGIVILNWNGLENTRRCLLSVLKITQTAISVVVIDNGSKNDEASQLDREFSGKITLLRNPENIGYTKACNQGIRWCLERKVDYVCLLNNDSHVAPDFLEQLLQVARKSDKIGILTPKIFSSADPERIWHTGGTVSLWTAKTNGLLFANIKKERPFYTKFDYCPGTAVLIRSQVIRDIGMLPEIYFAYMEDVEYCRKAKQAGWFLAYVPSSHAWHKGYASTGGDPFSVIPLFLRVRNRILFIRRNGRWIHRKVFFVAHVIYCLIMTARALVPPQFALVDSIVRGLYSGYIDQRLSLERLPLEPEDIV